MMNGIKSMQEAVERIRDAQNVQIFQNELLLLKEYMKNIGMEKEDLLKLERTAYYIKNEYSDKDTKENMEAAKERVVRYIEDIIYDNTDDESLLKILGNFYLFLEALLERVPDKRGGIQQEKLALLKIENESSKILSIHEIMSVSSRHLVEKSKLATSLLSFFTISTRRHINILL